MQIHFIFCLRSDSNLFHRTLFCYLNYLFLSKYWEYSEIKCVDIKLELCFEVTFFNYENEMKWNRYYIRIITIISICLFINYVKISVRTGILLEMGKTKAYSQFDSLCRFKVPYSDVKHSSFIQGDPKVSLSKNTKYSILRSTYIIVIHTFFLGRNHKILKLHFWE